MDDYNNDDEFILEQKEEEVEQLSWWERVKYIFIDPARTMKYLAEHPKVLFPVLCIIIGFFGLNFVKMDLLLEFTKEQMIIQMSKLGGASGQMGVPDEFVKFATWGALAGAALGPIASWFFKGLIIHLLAKAFKGTGKLKTALSAVGYAYLIVLLGEGIRTIIALITRNYLVMTSLALFLPEPNIGSPLFSILGSIDVFSIWYLVVLTIGLSHTHKIEMNKSGIVVFGSWVAMICLSVGAVLLKG